jgi:deoxycitidine kinase/deoxyguanosine kinase
MKIISIEGNIGSGKSTILNFLKEITKTEKEDASLIFLLEPVDEWEKIVDSDGTNILTKYYADQERYAFSFQMMAFITRLRQINEIIGKYSNQDVIVVTERCIFTDREIFAKMLFNDSKIEKIEYSIYINWFDYFVKNINIDKYIYINTPPDICLERISKRNRTGESIPLEYLQKLDNFHKEWLGSKENMIEIDGTSEINTNNTNNIINELFV